MFSTQGDLIIGLKLTVTLPADYFIAQSSPVGVLSSSAGFTSLSCSLSSFLSLNVICTVGNATLPAGAHNISFAAGQLTTGSTLARDDVGLSVKTDVDRRSVFAPSLEISAGRVQSASMSMSVEDGFRFKIPARGFNLKSLVEFEKSLDSVTEHSFKEITKIEFEKMIYGKQEPVKKRK